MNILPLSMQMPRSVIISHFTVDYYYYFSSLFFIKDNRNEIRSKIAFN